MPDSTLVSDILFFVARGGLSDSQDLLVPVAETEKLQVWRPTPASSRPRGMSLLPYAVWWAFHYLRIFRNDQYKIFLLRKGERILHRSCVFPPYFRFPFMDACDVQVGDIWTHESNRGQGKGTRMLRHIVRAHAGRRVWYLCEADNVASINLALSGGMKLYARGRREGRLGVGLLGRFVISDLV